MPTALKAAGAVERTRNPLRPHRLADVIGQDRTKSLLARAIQNAWARKQPLDHILFVGPSGVGKTTLANAVGNDLGAHVYQLAAPIDTKTLLDLRTKMLDGDILFVDEIHLQAIQERRGRGASTEPEVLYGVMEDGTITTRDGVLPYPRITIIGGTTDEGMLPDAFINRFPIRPRLEPYVRADLVRIVYANAEALGLDIDRDAATLFADASRGVPREINNLMKNAGVLVTGPTVDLACAREVLDNFGLTSDGLTADMQAMLTFLLTKARRHNAAGDVVYQASVNTVATAIGKSRDSKAIALRVEPYLIEKGYVQVGHGGRLLTSAGVQRAKELIACR